MKKIIALDIDGTLTNSKKEITKPTLDKIMENPEKRTCCGNCIRTAAAWNPEDCG